MSMTKIQYISTANIVANVENKEEEKEIIEILKKLRKLNSLVCSINEY